MEESRQVIISLKINKTILKLWHVITPSPVQRYFLANLIIADLFLAVCAWFRGSGSIGEWFFVGGYKLTPWCVVFTLMLNVSWLVKAIQYKWFH